MQEFGEISPRRPAFAVLWARKRQAGAPEVSGHHKSTDFDNSLLISAPLRGVFYHQGTLFFEKWSKVITLRERLVAHYERAGLTRPLVRVRASL